jgi:hypothetical protein
MCPKHVEVDWQNKLRLNIASIWSSLEKLWERFNHSAVGFYAKVQAGLVFLQ